MGVLDFIKSTLGKVAPAPAAPVTAAPTGHLSFIAGNPPAPIVPKNQTSTSPVLSYVAKNPPAAAVPKPSSLTDSSTPSVISFLAKNPVATTIPGAPNVADWNTVNTHKAKLITQVPFTNEAKDIINQHTAVNFNRPLPAGIAGQTEMSDPRLGPTSIEMQPKNNDFDQFKFSHEVFNTIFLRSQTNPNDFNAAWEKAKAGPDSYQLKRIDGNFDDPSTKAAFHGNGEEVNKDPYAKATERFAMLGSQVGINGISAIPKPLQFFYRKYLADFPDSQTTDKLEPGQPDKLLGENIPVVGGILRAGKAAGNTALETLKDTGARATDLLYTLGGIKTDGAGKPLLNPDWGRTDTGKREPYYQSTLSTTDGDYTHPTDPKTLAIDRVTKMISLASGGLNMTFIPATAGIKAAEQLPVIGQLAHGIDYIFGKAGELGQWEAPQIINALPLSDETKKTITPLAQELTGLLNQIAAGELAHQTGADITDRYKDLKASVEDKTNKGLPLTPTEKTYAKAQDVRGKIKDAIVGGIKDVKDTYANMTPAQKQAGKIKNPFAGKDNIIPGDPEGTLKKTEEKLGIKPFDAKEQQTAANDISNPETAPADATPSRTLPTDEVSMVDHLKKEYPDGINLIHQTSDKGTEGISKSGFRGDGNDNVFFSVEKSDPNRATAGGNSSSISIKIKPEDYGMLLPDEGSYDGSDAERIQQMFENGFVGSDVTVPADIANKYLPSKESRFSQEAQAFKEKGFDKISTAARATRKLSEEDLGKISNLLKNRENADRELAVAKDVLDQNSLSDLEKFMDPIEKQLPEVTGKDKYVQEGNRTLSKTKQLQNQFAREGDQILTQYGFDSSEAGRSAFEDYISQKERVNAMREESILRKKADILMSKSKTERRAKLRLIKEAFNLTDNELQKVRNGRNIIDMGEEEFANFLSRAQQEAADLEHTRDARIQVEATIANKELKKTENLQKAMKLPDLNKMNFEQLTQFDKILSEYHQGDEFLTQRMLETIDRTDIAGVKTYREAREKLQKVLNLSDLESRGNLVDEFDRMRWDTALAEKNPFYKYMVEKVQKEIFTEEASFIEKENRVNELFNRLRKGTGVINKLIPTDERIFAYLEASPQEKITLAKTMTPDEYAAAEYVRGEYAKALQHEYEQQVLRKSRFEDAYVTHIRRDYLESIKSELQKDGNPLKAIWEATKELLDSRKQDFAVLNILDQKTGDILPFEKWFKYSMKRSGDLNPSKNVARAFTEYMRVFHTKAALDRTTPELMTYVHVLTPREYTPKGLELDDRLQSFVKEFLNNKKGRRAKLAATPGGVIDGGMRAINSIVSMIDLGLNFKTQLASFGGELAGTYVVTGEKGMAKGIARQFMPKYRTILEKYENYTGKTPWNELFDANKGLSSKMGNVMFGLFKYANILSKKIHLLASLTPEEIESGTVSSQRLAEIRTELGRWLPMDKSESILGSTVEGAAATKYRKWAIAAMRTLTKDVAALPGILKNRGVKEFAKSKEFNEFRRTVMISASMSLLAYGMSMDLSKNPKNESWTRSLERKLLQDGMSLLSALDPRTWAQPPRAVGFMMDMATALGDIVHLEKYTTNSAAHKKGDLKGVSELKNTLTPNVVRTVRSLLTPQDQSSKAAPKSNSPIKGLLKGKTKISGMKLNISKPSTTGLLKGKVKQKISLSR